MFNFFKKRTPVDFSLLKTDIHSHLLPGIDDGAQDIEESVNLVKELIKLGYKKLIVTPHIMQDYYPNTPEVIKKKHKELVSRLKHENVEIKIEAAAEYYLDEFLMEEIKNTDNLLTFGKNYVLFEMSFFNESPFIKEFIFSIKSAGLIPVLAHPERYSYYFNKWDVLEDLGERGVYFQLNINSLSGYYSKEVQKMAEQFIDRKMVKFLGSDCHNMKHIEIINDSRFKKYCEKAINLPLLNVTV